MATAASSPLASSPAKTNGNKLSRLLIDGGTTVLRNIFDHYHPPTTLASDLNSNYSILNNLLRRRVLNGRQWDKLFPPGGGVPDSSTFDITLLFLLLTNICGLSPPPLTGWHNKPSPGDNSLEADLARVKFFRNELYGHVTSTGVDATSFSSFWQEISITLRSLGLDQAEIDRLKAEQGGEDKYLNVLIEWASSEEGIRTLLQDIRQFQTTVKKTIKENHQSQLELINQTLQSLTLKLEEIEKAQRKTQDGVEEVLKMELKGQKVLHDADKSALVGSPACKYITMLNTDAAFDWRNGGEVKEIACSLKGDTIYSTTSEFVQYSLDTSRKVTLVTALRMSNREELNTIELPGSVSIFPTRDGVVLLKDDGAELWTFDMSTSLRSLSEVTPSDVVFSISEERISRFYSPGPLHVFRSDPIPSRMWQHFVIEFLDVTSASSMIVSSLEIFLDFNEDLLSVVCSNPSQVLLCTASEKVTVSSWKNGVILWERTCWTDTARIITAIKPQMVFSPKSELVVTWNTLNQGHGLHILNADTGETKHVFLRDKPDIAIVDCKFLDDESLVCCSEDNFLRLYNLSAGGLLSVLDIGEQPFCLGASLYHPLVAIGLSGARTKFLHVQLPKETKKKTRLVSFLFNRSWALR